MALILKEWNKNKFPDRQQRLNSYSMVLMLIAFLQHKKILPNLQSTSSERKPHVEYLKYSKIGGKFYEEYICRSDVSFINDATLRGMESTESIADLFIGFLFFYSIEFDGQKQMISISSNDGPFISKETYRATLNKAV